MSSERKKQWVDVLMSIEKTIEETREWMESSATARKTINYYATQAANKIVQRTEQNYKFVYDKVEEGVLAAVGALISVGKITDIPPWQTAEIEKERILKLYPDRSDWESIKNYEIQQVRLSHLESIIEKKVEREGDLLPIELFALDDKLSFVDVTADNRYNAYTGFIEDRFDNIVDDLRANVYEDEREDIIKRQDQIREMHRLKEDKKLIARGTENEVWKMINKEWGIDNGLE